MCVSVPRFKLTAAVLAAKVANFLINELDITFSKFFLLTDSTYVLRYSNYTSVRFTTFIANQLEIYIYSLIASNGITYHRNKILHTLPAGLFGLIKLIRVMCGFTGLRFCVTIGLINRTFCVM